MSETAAKYDGGSGLAVIHGAEGGLVARRDDWDEARIEFVRRHFCSNAPETEAALFIQIARQMGLSPEQKQIYLVPRQTGFGDNRKTTWTIQTGIDGYRLTADRTGNYAGSDEPIFEGWESTPYTTGSGQYQKQIAIAHPVLARVTVRKFVRGQVCSFAGVAYWDEYVQPSSPMWAKMPRTMLAKCAEALALRKAFPAELAGIYTAEEMDQADRPEPSVRGSVHRIKGPEIIAGDASGPVVDTWTVFWRESKKLGIQNATEYQHLTGQNPTSMQPATAFDLLTDCLHEVHSEEAGVDVPDDDEVIEGEIVATQEEASSDPFLEAIEKATTQDALSAVARDIQKIPDATPEQKRAWDAAYNHKKIAIAKTNRAAADAATK